MKFIISCKSLLRKSSFRGKMIKHFYSGMEKSLTDDERGFGVKTTIE